MTSSGKVCASSHWETKGAISASANSRTALRSWICSGVYSKSTAAPFMFAKSDDLFLRGIPADGALLAVAFHRHAAGDGDAEADFKRAVGLRGAADGIDEVLHVRLGIAARDTGHVIAVFAVDLLGVILEGLRGVGDGAVIAADGIDEALQVRLGIGARDTGNVIAVFAVDLLGVILEGLRGVGDGAVIAEDVFGDAELIVAEAGVPGVEQLLFMLHADVHGIGHFAAVLPEVDAADHGDGAGNLEIQYLVPDGKLVAHVLVDVAAG